MSTPVRQIRAGRWRVDACSQTPSASMCCRQRGRPRADPSDPRESSVRASSARAVWSSRSTLAAPRRARTDSASAAPGRRVHTSTCCASRRATTSNPGSLAVVPGHQSVRGEHESSLTSACAPTVPLQCPLCRAPTRRRSRVHRCAPPASSHRSRLKHVGTTPRKAPTSSRRQRGRALRPLLSPTRCDVESSALQFLQRNSGVPPYYSK